MPSEPGSVVVIGGGVIGCFIAYRLAVKGVSVTLVEKGDLGAGASGISGGNILPNGLVYGEFQAQLGAESLELFRRFLPSIKRSSGIDPLDQEVRYLFAALNDDEVQRARGHLETLRRAGLKVMWLDGAEARQMEPRLSPEVRGAILHQDCIQLDSLRFVSALAASARTLGVRTVLAQATGLRREGASMTAVHLRGEDDIRCDTVVLATGQWAGVVAREWLGIALPIYPRALQRLHLRARGPALACAVNGGGINVVARRDGLVHAGSKHDAAGFDARPTEEGRAWILERVDKILPGLDVEVAESRAACASETSDNIPILGPLPSLDSVYIASPAFEGFLLSAVLAEALTDLLVRGEEHRFLARLLPERVLSG